MTRKIHSRRSIGLIAVVGIIFALTAYAHAEEKKIKYRLPSGLYIELPQEFLEPSDEDDSEGTRIYTNRVSSHYLEQIAASNDLLVQTNRQIIKQQEKIIQLLEILVAKSKSQP